MGDDTCITITVRVIRSFEYRTFRNIVLHNQDLATLTGSSLMKLTLEKLSDIAPPFLNHTYNVLKIYSQPHSAKTNCTIINIGKDDELRINNLDLPLSEYSVQNETELSLFNDEDYQKFIKNPTTKWY